ncbi:MAG TPA: FtsX-like permease family protein, partial [Candidatus Dormibacteraeota bacterium]|nr:FtsX-like permease family protein [Candidatus Dormibacteraeota bacterium]
RAALDATGAGTGVIVPADLAQARGWTVGSRIDLMGTSGGRWFTVAGVVAHTVPGPGGAEAVLMSRTAASRTFGTAADGFDVLQVLPAPGVHLARALRLAAFRYGMEEVSVATVRAGVGRAIAHAVALLNALAVIGVVIALLAAMDALLLQAREGVQELALLRTIGLSRADVRGVVVAEAVATALVGTVLGAGLGLGLLWPAVGAIATATFAPQYLVPVATLGGVIGAVLIAVLLAAAIPARQLARRSAVEALHAE